MKIIIEICLTCITLLFSVCAAEAAGTYYHYTDTSSTRKTTTWVPDGLTRVRGILLNGNGFGGDYTGHAYHFHKQAFCEKHDFILVATGYFTRFADGIGGDDWNVLQDALNDAATRSGYTEITNAPFVNYGFSNGGQMAYDLAYLIPERTIAFCANKGGYYITETNGPAHVPGIFIAGETDSTLRRNSISNLYAAGRSTGALWAWLEEENVGHDYGNSEALLFGFYDEVIQQRYPTNLYPTAATQPLLLDVVETNGWLVSQSVSEWESGFSTIQPSAGYAGDKARFGWVPGEKIAQLYRAAASFDRSVSTAFSPCLKPMVTRFPGDPLGYSTGKLYYPGQPVHYEFDIAPSITGWQKAEIFDGTNKLTEVMDNSSNTVGVDVLLDASQGNNSLYAVLTLSNGTKRVSHVSMLQSDTLRTTSIPDALAASDATDSAATNSSTQTFSWTTPTNAASVLGYSYALDEEPDETTEGTGTSVTYSNIPNGTHTFKVRAQSTSGVWGPSAAFTLIIESLGTINVSTNNLLVPEGDSASFDVFMEGAATESVTLTVSRVSGDTDLSISNGSSLVFAAGEWTNTQSVTLSAAEDADTTAGQAVFSITAPKVTATSVTAYEQENDLQLLSSAGTLDVAEGGTNTFSLTLNIAPPSPVTATVQRTSGDTDLTVAGTASFVFNNSNWNHPQTVTIAAAEDADQTDGSAQFTCSAPDAASVFLSVSEADNDYEIVATGLLAAWNLDSASEAVTVTSTNAYFTATGLVHGVLTHSNPSKVRGANNSIKAIDTDDATIAESIATGNYFYWQVVPQSNYLVTITSVVVRTDVDDNTPVETFLLSDASGINDASVLAQNTSGDAKTDTVDLSGQAAFQKTGESIEFRVYGYKGPSAWGNAVYIGEGFRVDGRDDIQVYGNVAYSRGGSSGDEDGDGLPDDWEQQHYGSTSIAPTNIAANGMNTVREAYIAGLNPTNPTALFEIHQLQNKVLQWIAVSGRVYSIDWSTNLISGFQTLETNLTGGVFTDSVHRTEHKIFYRIQVRLEE